MKITAGKRASIWKRALVIAAAILCILTVPLLASANQSGAPDVQENVEAAESTSSVMVLDPPSKSNTTGEDLNVTEGTAVVAQADAVVVEDESEAVVDEPATQSDESDAIDSFDKLKAAVEDPSGPAEITLAANINATDAITVSRAVTIKGAGFSMTRDSQTHSIFVVEVGGDLSFYGLKLRGDEAVEKASDGSSTPVISSGVFRMRQGSEISDFVSYDGGGLKIRAGYSEILQSSISGNHVDEEFRDGLPHARGGGILLEGGKLVLGDKSTVSRNIASCSTRDEAYGGGIFAKGGELIIQDGASVSDNLVTDYDPAVNTADSMLGGGIFIAGGVKFSMLDGVISNNRCDGKGGGICFGYDFYGPTTNAGDIELKKGSIEGNSAANGGGIYLANNNALDIDFAAITNNTGRIGGGLWTCSRSNIGVYTTSGCYLSGNTMTRFGSDFDTNAISQVSQLPHISARLIDGSPVLWYQDSPNGGAWYSSQFGDDPITDMDWYVITWFGTEVLHGWGDDLAVKSVAADLSLYPQYQLLIQGNSAEAYGGGIAANGILRLGEDNDKEMIITKSWAGLDEDYDASELPDEVRVKVFNGDVQIDEVVLNEDNDWTEKLIDLPGDGNYSVEEIEVDGFIATYEITDKVTTAEDPVPGYVATITNTKLESGKLTINKSLLGNFQAIEGDNGRIEGDITAVFHVVGESADGTLVYDQYVGMNFSSDDALEQSVTLENLPVGSYTITEVSYDGDGYESNDGPITVQVPGENGEPVVVEFTNTADHNDKPNVGIVNRYTPNAENSLGFDIVQFLRSFQAQGN